MDYSLTNLGSYLVTYQPKEVQQNRACYTRPADLVYTVTLINECATAEITIDPDHSIFKNPPDISVTHYIMTEMD